VYCGQIYDVENLTVDHVQPRVKGGDRSGGNLVTACQSCNTAKGHVPLANFLATRPEIRQNFFRYARFVWPRILRTLK
jgi:5-methylcytosine-specific restriction endonuclease McrA